MFLLYCIILNTRQPSVTTRPALAKNRNGASKFLEKAKKVRPPTKIGNVSFVKLHHEYEYTKLQDAYQEKKSRLDPQSPRF